MKFEGDIKVCKDADGVVDQLKAILKKVCQGDTTVGLSGGSLPKFFVAAAKQLKDVVDWSRVKFLFCDERLVPFSDGDSTFGVFENMLLKDGEIKGITKDNFILVDTGLDPAKAAQDYAKKLSVYGALPSFDLLLLGMGPDGHTCSLFPGHPLLKESTKIVAEITDSPKPPPCRVTLTFPVLNNAKNVAFVATGTEIHLLMNVVAIVSIDFVFQGPARLQF